MSDLDSIPTNPAERDFVLLLISLYRDSPELWKIKSKDYQNKEKKNQAYERILAVLKTCKPEYDIEKLKKKINVLRTNFNREYQKIYQKWKSGASADDVLEPKLWYYNDFLFIKDDMETAETDASEQKQFNQPAVPAKKKKLTANDNTKKLVDLATKYFEHKKPQSETEIQAKAWDLKLKRLAPDQRRFAEKIINDTLFEAEMGTLTRNGVVFFTSTSMQSGPYFSPSYSRSPSP